MHRLPLLVLLMGLFVAACSESSEPCGTGEGRADVSSSFQYQAANPSEDVDNYDWRTGVTSARGSSEQTEQFLYSGSLDNTVRKITLTGEEAWSYDYGAIVRVVRSTAGAHIFVGGDGNSVEKISKETGRPVSEGSWPFSAPSARVRAIQEDAAGNVYVGAADNRLYKLDAAGNLLWCYRGFGSTVISLEVHPEGGVVAGSLRNGVRYIRENHDGVPVQLWSFRKHRRRIQGLAVRHGHVYTAGIDGYLYKLDLDGNSLWGLLVSEQGMRAVVVLSDGRVVVTSDDANVYLIDEDELGRPGVRWTFTMHSERADALAIDENDFIYSGSRDGVIRKIDPDTGEEILDKRWPFAGHGQYIEYLDVDPTQWARSMREASPTDVDP